jgi:hypothetical protein
MEEAISFFRAFEFWIYLLLGLGALFFIRKFFIAWQELKDAAFGLERESAQARLNQSATILVLILSLAVSEFVLVYFVAPNVPAANSLPTPTMDLLATPTLTLPAVSALPGENPVNSEATLLDSATSPGCIPGQIQILVPLEGEQISGVVEVLGTADIPDFGFYKLEIKRPDETIWLTLQAGNEIVRESKLGDWDTRRLTPGEYQLGIVVVDNEAQASSPCIVNLFVVRAPEETPNP